MCNTKVWLLTFKDYKMSSCAVFGCSSYHRRTKGSQIRYFCFPKNPDLAAIWANACKRKDKMNIKNARICSMHFREDNFEISLKQRLLNYPKIRPSLKADAIPTEKLPNSRKPIDMKRAARYARRSRSKEVNDLLKAALSKDCNSKPGEEVVSDTRPQVRHDFWRKRTKSEAANTSSDVDSKNEIALSSFFRPVSANEDEMNIKLEVKQEPDYDINEHINMDISEHIKMDISEHIKMDISDFVMEFN